jgi:hypothetical protein
MDMLDAALLPAIDEAAQERLGHAPSSIFEAGYPKQARLSPSANFTLGR